MAAFNKVNGFVEHLAEKVHDLGGDTLKIALSNTAPGSETPDPSVNTADCILGNVTAVSTTALDSVTVTTTGSSQTGGTYKLVCNDITMTSTGGNTGPFQYVYLYNDTSTSPADPLIGYYDYGSSITLSTGETFTVDWSAASGVLTIA